MGLVAVALHRHVALGQKRPIDAAVVVVPKMFGSLVKSLKRLESSTQSVLLPVLRVLVFRPNPGGFSLVLRGAALEALRRHTWEMKFNRS